MSGIFAAFVALVSVAVLGYLVGLGGVLRAQDEVVLSRLAFFIASPALLFTTVATADLRSILSPVLVTGIVGVVVVQAVFMLVARLIWRRSRAEATVGALASSYVNAGNLGIPVSVYVLGDGALIAPILLFQLLVMAPVAFLILDGGSGGPQGGPGRRSAWVMLRHSVWRVLRRPLRNPITVATLLGLSVTLIGIDIPKVIMQPIGLVAAAAVPVALMAYGLSLSGARTVPVDAAEKGAHRDLVLAVLLKAFAQPAVAYLTGRVLLDLHGTTLLAATLFGALPTAQNVYVYAVHYRTGRTLARGAVLLSTALSIPIMLAISGLLG